jgi:hypothetical protein
VAIERIDAAAASDTESTGVSRSRSIPPAPPIEDDDCDRDDALFRALLGLPLALLGDLAGLPADVYALPVSQSCRIAFGKNPHLPQRYCRGRPYMIGQRIHRRSLSTRRHTPASQANTNLKSR